VAVSDLIQVLCNYVKRQIFSNLAFH